MAKVVPNWTKLIPTLETRNGSELLCKINNIDLLTLTGVFIVSTCFTLVFFCCSTISTTPVEYKSQLSGVVAKVADELILEYVKTESRISKNNGFEGGHT